MNKLIILAVFSAVSLLSTTSRASEETIEELTKYVEVLGGYTCFDKGANYGNQPSEYSNYNFGCYSRKIGVTSWYTAGKNDHKKRLLETRRTIREQLKTPAFFDALTQEQ